MYDTSKLTLIATYNLNMGRLKTENIITMVWVGGNTFIAQV